MFYISLFQLKIFNLYYSDESEISERVGPDQDDADTCMATKMDDLCLTSSLTNQRYAI